MSRQIVEAAHNAGVQHKRRQKEHKMKMNAVSTVTACWFTCHSAPVTVATAVLLW